MVNCSRLNDPDWENQWNPAFQVLAVPTICWTRHLSWIDWWLETKYQHVFFVAKNFMKRGSIGCSSSYKILSPCVSPCSYRRQNFISNLNFQQTLLQYQQSTTRSFHQQNTCLSEKKFSKEQILTNFLKLARSGNEKQFSVEGFEKDVGTQGYFKAFIAKNNNVHRIEVPDSESKPKTSNNEKSVTRKKNNAIKKTPEPSKLKDFNYSFDDNEEVSNEDIDELEEDDDIHIGSINEFGYTYKGNTNNSLNAIHVLKQAEEFLLKNKSVKGFGALKKYETSNPFIIEQDQQQNTSVDNNNISNQQTAKPNKLSMKHFPSDFPLPETTSPIKNRIENEEDENIEKDFYDKEDEKDDEDLPQIFIHSEAFSLYQFFKIEMENTLGFDYKEVKLESVDDLSTEQLDELIDFCGEDSNLVRYGDSPQLSRVEVDDQLSMQEIIEKMKQVPKRLRRKKGDIEYIFSFNKDKGRIERKRVVIEEDIYKPLRLNIAQNEEAKQKKPKEKDPNAVLDMILEKLSGKSIQDLTKQEIEEFKQKIKQVPELLNAKALGPLINKFYKSNDGKESLDNVSLTDIDKHSMEQNATGRVWEKEKGQIFKKLFGQEYSNEEVDYILQTPEFQRMMDSPTAKYQTRRLEEYEKESVRPTLQMLEDKEKMDQFKQKLGFSPADLAKMNLPKNLREWQDFFSVSTGPKPKLNNKLESQLQEVGKHMREVEHKIQTRGMTEEESHKLRQQVFREKVSPILTSPNKK